jgi:hypothetical protein
MQNPLFLILIVRRNRDYSSEAGKLNLFNEHGNTDKKREYVAISNSDNPKSVPYPGNDSHSDNGQQGNVYLKPEKRK